MLTLKNNFTYKYSTCKHIYCITDRKCASSHRMGVYSVPHKNERVVIGFADFEQCYVYVGRLQQEMNNLEIEAVRLDLNEVKYISCLMKLPVCVILNEGDQENESGHFDVHYHRLRSDVDEIRVSSFAETCHQTDL